MTRGLDALLCGYYGFGNLGDELLAEAVVSLLAENGVEKERIGILSAAPEETSEKLGVTAFDRWKLKEIDRAVKMSRTLLLGGGGLFQDVTSVKSSLYYWWVVRAARMHGAKPWAVGQSIGPLRSLIASAAAKNAFSSCAYRSVRNGSSLGTLNNWGLMGSITPDLVMSLRVNRDFKRGDILLLNLRPGHDRLARLAVRYASAMVQERGLRTVGVAFSQEDADELEKYRNMSLLKLEQITVVKTLREFENITDNSCCAVGMRLHFLILCQLAGLPSCGAPYDPKVRVYCEEWEIPAVGAGKADFSVPPDAAVIDESAARIRESFKQGLGIVLGEEDGKK